jgi:hypothetical protein
MNMLGMVGERRAGVHKHAQCVAFASSPEYPYLYCYRGTEPQEGINKGRMWLGTEGGQPRLLHMRRDGLVERVVSELAEALLLLLSLRPAWVS